MKKVRIGIIGCGGIARNRHIPELLRCSDAVITAICDTDEKNLALAQEKIGGEGVKCYKDYRTLICDPCVDAVEICTPNYLHAEMAIACLEAGKPVNVEKPIAMCAYEARRIIDAEQKSSAFGMTCFSYRFMPSVRYAVRLLQEGVIGRVIGVNATYAKSSALWEGRRLEWRFVKSLGAAGVSADLGVHLVDLAQLLAGEITELSAMTDIVIKERTTLDGSAVAPVETDDNCFFLARFAGGASGTFHITRAAIGHANTIKFDVYGTKGSISFVLDKPVPDTLILIAGEGDPKNFAPREVKVPKEYYLTQEQCFIDAVYGKRDDLWPSLAAGLQGQRIIDAILESSEHKKWVSI